MEATGCMVQRLDPHIEGDTPFDKLMGMLATLRPSATEIHASENAQVAVHGGTIVNATVEEHVVPPGMKDAVIQALLSGAKPKQSPPHWFGQFALKRSRQSKRSK